MVCKCEHEDSYQCVANHQTEMIITLKRARRAYEDHGNTLAELIEDLGEHDVYLAHEVLQKLGY